jgi:hypothetical protein
LGIDFSQPALLWSSVGSLPFVFIHSALFHIGTWLCNYPDQQLCALCDVTELLHAFPHHGKDESFKMIIFM